MELKIDTTKKVITVIDEVSIEELLTWLSEHFKDYKKYKVVSNYNCWNQWSCGWRYYDINQSQTVPQFTYTDFNTTTINNSDHERP